MRGGSNGWNLTTMRESEGDGEKRKREGEAYLTCAITALPPMIQAHRLRRPKTIIRSAK